MKEVKNNRGFSLVELIIVIAIMAILIGVMAPQLIKYVEKSNVASDKQTLDAIYAAITYATYDPAVLKDPASKALIDQMVSAPMALEDLESHKTTALYSEILSSLNWPDLSQSTYLRELKSAHLSTSQIKFQYKGSLVNPLAMWITFTDSSGGKDTSVDPANYLDDANIRHCVSIY